MKNFKAEAEGYEFEFHTMNVKKLQLFQVYVIYEGKKLRFHMQVDDKGNFHITDKDHCPAELHKAEPMLNDAIKIYGQ